MLSNTSETRLLRIITVLLTLAAVFVAYLSSATEASASTFTFSPDTPGLTFTVDNLGLAGTDLHTADGVDDTYQILLTLTTTTDYVNAGSGSDLLAAFALSLSSHDIEGATLESAPVGYSWTLHEGNKVPGNSAKCEGGGGGSLCVEETASATDNLVLDANGVYSWLFDVDLDGAGFADIAGLDVGIGTLKKTGPGYAFQGTRALRGVTGSSSSGSGPTDTSGGTNGGPVDPLDIAPTAVDVVPEPGSLLLLGSGLLVVASGIRRQRRP